MNPNKIKFDELDYFVWLNIENIEIELIELQANVIWRNKFDYFNSEMEK